MCAHSRRGSDALITGGLLTFAPETWRSGGIARIRAKHPDITASGINLQLDNLRRRAYTRVDIVETDCRRVHNIDREGSRPFGKSGTSFLDPGGLHLHHLGRRCRRGG